MTFQKIQKYTLKVLLQKMKLLIHQMTLTYTQQTYQFGY